LHRLRHCGNYIDVVLGPMMEENLRRAMLHSRGDPTPFITRPLTAAARWSILIVLPNLRRKRAEVFAQGKNRAYR
jgi:putative tricarboxylic transport membrane protein